MLHAMKLALLALALFACGSKDDKKQEPAGSATPTVKPASELFTGTQVTLPAPLAKVRFGMTDAEAKAAATDGDVPAFDHVKAHVSISKKGGVYSMYIELPDTLDAAKAYLAQKWGQPLTKNDAIGRPEYYWNAPDAGLQAKLVESKPRSILYFSQILPFTKMLALAFDKQQVIGMTPEAATAAFADFHPFPSTQDPDELVVGFPPAEGTGEVGSQIALRIKNNKITGYTFTLIPSQPGHAQLDQLVAKLEALFGKGKPADSYVKYGTQAQAELRPDRGDATVWVGDYKKAP